MTLLALTALCRPSDIAPQTIFLEGHRFPSTQTHPSSYDSQRQGFEVRLHKAENKKVDPVECLLTYLEKNCPLHGKRRVCLPHPEPPFLTSRLVHCL
ncbi:hypothetical protein PoB_002097800 [Plakobranchus ocellatus]|uniref:Uncharacterized protein n=1 Tax=Plakobranchus ocellatus TaxID=259542 RepID=A0AAV3ZI32_9GAST|nr:hypothetical protein PoB_002097800 [Plakobranchus ocellatus]